MLKRVIFNTGSSSLTLRPSDGTAIINTAFSDAKITGRRRFEVNSGVFQFTEPAETVDLLYVNLDTDFTWGVFYSSGQPTINDESGIPDPVYSPTDLNGQYVNYESPVNLDGVNFQYLVNGDELKIVATCSESVPIQSDIPVTFTIPYFLVRNTGPEQDGKRYMTNLSITTVINISMIVPEFTGTLDSVASVYLKADGVNLLQSVGRITFSASNLMVDGNLLSVGEVPLVVVHSGGESLLSLTGAGEVSTSVDLPPGRYVDGDIVLKVKSGSLDPPYFNGSISLGAIDVTPPLNASVNPIPLANGTYLLRIQSVTYDGDPLIGTLTVEEQNPKEDSISIDLSTNPYLGLYGPYTLTYNSIYYLKYVNSKYEFGVNDSVIGTVDVQTTDSDASVTFTPDLTAGLMLVNNASIDIYGELVDDTVYKLFDSSGTLVGSNTYDFVNPVTFNISGLSSGTSYTYSLKWSGTFQTNDGTTTNTYDVLSVSDLPVTFTTGGGGGGGGGNNGGNGYNNMATLELAYDGYEGTVSQTNTITVLGESREALTADEVITVNVPLDNFKKVLKYASTWDAALTGDEDGEQPLPRVKFTPTESGAALTELQAMLTGLSAKGTGAAAARLWADSANADHQVFGGIMLGSVTFTNSALDDDEVPRESIRKIVEGDLTVPDIDSTVTALDSQGAAETLRGQLESLFEQAVSAGRVKTTDAADADGFKNPSFEAGDSISFLVKYNFAKTRAYEVDDQVVDSATAGRATITVNGQTIQLAGYSEESDPYSRTYEIKLVATA